MNYEIKKISSSFLLILLNKDVQVIIKSCGVQLSVTRFEGVSLLGKNTQTGITQKIFGLNRRTALKSKIRFWTSNAVLNGHSVRSSTKIL